MSDHPLCKLFGECQFSVTQFLQPLVRTIEQSGELPHLKISRDNSGYYKLVVIILYLSVLIISLYIIYMYLYTLY